MNKKMLILIVAISGAHASLEAGAGIRIVKLLYKMGTSEYDRRQKEQAKRAHALQVSAEESMKATPLTQSAIFFKNMPSQTASKPILFKVLPERMPQSSGVGLAGILQETPSKPGIVHRTIQLDTMATMLDHDIKARTGKLSDTDRQFKEAEQGLLVVLRDGSMAERKRELHDLLAELKKLKHEAMPSDIAITASNLERGAEAELARIGNGGLAH